jgi:hypothetical protein
MRAVITLVLACGGLAAVQPVAAETLRCGSVLIEPGDDAAYVLEKCVTAPDSASQLAFLSVADGNLYPLGFAQLQRWRIARKPGQFRAVVVIGADGRVEDIQFERRREEAPAAED